MTYRWGRLYVTNPLDVYLVLIRAPGGRARYAAWEVQISIEPPTWGSDEAQGHALVLGLRGFHVWTWDDYGVVYSQPNKFPPRGVTYHPWRILFPDELP